LPTADAVSPRLDLAADSAYRLATYRRLAMRNRIVAILRIGVPALGSIVLVALVIQIYIASFANQFGVGNISITRDTITVESPEYAGTLDDGSTYRVWSDDAQAAVGNTEIIDLTGANLVLNRAATGITMNVNAPEAALDTTRQVVVIDGIAYVEDSTGTRATLHQSEFNWVDQFLDSKGAVHVDYADGATVDAQGLVYDAKTQVWTFSRATVTLPATPGTSTEGTTDP
jgi:lipopolysaccharide export system protein LptC